MINNVGIIGMGVIGASLGMALRSSRPGISIAGRDVDIDTVKQAIEVGAIDEILDDQRLAECDLIVIATPLRIIPQVVKDIKEKLKPGTIISDVGSVKGWVMQVFQQNLPGQIHIIGGHPMAGSEKSGLSAADKFLFQNAAYVLTPQSDIPADIIEEMQLLISAIGARVIIMNAEEHDQVVAQVSHIPHLMSTALINNLHDKTQAMALAGGGLRDTTRTAASDPDLWEDIIMFNAAAVTHELKGMMALLQKYLTALEAENGIDIKPYLQSARDLRKNLPSIRPCLEDSCDIIAIIPDQPGVIGELGLLLGQQQINIQNLQLLGVRDEDEGTIRITVKREFASIACQLLKENGFSAWMREI